MTEQFNLKKSRYELVRVLREEFGIHNSKAWSIMKRVEEQDDEFIKLLKEKIKGRLNNPADINIIDKLSGRGK